MNLFCKVTKKMVIVFINVFIITEFVTDKKSGYDGILQE